LFFANANYVQGRIQEAIAEHRFESVSRSTAQSDLCTDSLELIESLHRESITFVFARLHGPVADRLQEAGVLDLVGEEHSYPTVSAAVQDAPATD
jgi:MFS superfamily sulfate permease-like transporter